MDSESHNLSHLLTEFNAGDRAAEAEIFSRVYEELHGLASRYLRSERPDHTLQATALVNEAYFRLVGVGERNCRNRSHFIGIAAQVMRHILVDHARQHQSLKRGSNGQKLPLDQVLIVSPGQSEEILALDEALSRLGALDPKQNRIVELKYFAGMTVEEIAALLELSTRSVEREWQLARAYLYEQLK